MRFRWRFLLSRNYPRPSPKLPTPTPHSSHFHPHSSSSPTLPSTHDAISRAFLPSRIARSFSSDPIPEPSKETDPHSVIISQTFSNDTELADVDVELERHGVVLTHELVCSFLRSPDVKPEAARRFFDWVSEKHGEKLGSKGYNLMLGMLGANGLREEFWGLVEVMKGKGFGVSRATWNRAMEGFEKEGLVEDLERLRGMFKSGSEGDSVKKVGDIVSRIVRDRVWGNDVENEIKDLVVVFSTNLVEVVLENLAMEPVKGLAFFRWVGEMVKHDARSYTAMAKILGRNLSKKKIRRADCIDWRRKCIDGFWEVVGEMRNNGYEMEMETYNEVLDRFVQRKMLKDAVDLTEFAMAGTNKPSVHCCSFLLKKIAAAKEFDMELFSRVVKIFMGVGCALTDSTLNSVLKSLASVGRYRECNKVLLEMKEGGIKDEASEFVDHLKSSGTEVDDQAWVSCIERHCISGDLEKASDSFKELTGKLQVSNLASYAFDYLVNVYCCKNRAIDAYKLLCDCIKEHQFRPWQKTYKVLINKLLAQGGFDKALKLLELMSKQGYPPLMSVVVRYVSKYGTNDDAVAFLEAMTSKRFQSPKRPPLPTSVALLIFRAFFRAGRHDKAQDLLSKCPGDIRNNADVLKLFNSMQSKKDIALAAS